jgi:hypothetical protein
VSGGGVEPDQVAGPLHREAGGQGDGRVVQVSAATGRSFAASQTHWYRLAEGRIVGHAADRDDLTQARVSWMEREGAQHG